MHNCVLQVAEDFEEMWNMPHCIGAMDGKHVNIECVDNSGSLDHNYKKQFSKSICYSRCKLQEQFLNTEAITMLCLHACVGQTVLK